MAKELRVLKAALRGERGKGGARRLRARGGVPAVIYGRGKESRPLELDRADLERAIRHGERLVKLDIGGQQNQAMVKEVQYQPVSRLISHVDFQEISATEAVTVEVPLKLRGTPAGAKDGGILDLVMHGIEVEARPGDIPEEIRVDVSALQVGDVIRAGAIPLPAGLKLVTDEKAAVVALEHPRGEEDVETQVAAAEGAAGPEVLTGKKEEAAPEAGAPAAPAAPAGEEPKPEGSG